MPDCEYCEESFDGEAAYLDHLGEEHEGELGSIDRRRLEARESEDAGGSLTRPALVLVGALVVGGVYLVFFSGLLSGGEGSAGGIETEPLPDRGDAALLSDVESYDGLERGHVETGSEIDYGTMPPVGGPHYNPTVDAGFYEESQSVGALVHNLEHGNVVIYYDPGALTDDAEESLEAFARAHGGDWLGVIVVPTPVEGSGSPYVLTAWGQKMALDEYDAERVRAFIAEYLGRGPENDQPGVPSR